MANIKAISVRANDPLSMQGRLTSQKNDMAEVEKVEAGVDHHLAYAGVLSY